MEPSRFNEVDLDFEAKVDFKVGKSRLEVDFLINFESILCSKFSKILKSTSSRLESKSVPCPSKENLNFTKMQGSSKSP